MKIATSLTCLFCLFSVLTFLSPQLFAMENLKEYRRDQWDFDLGMGYFLSDANYLDFGGGRKSLDGGHQYQLLDFNLSTRYMPQKNKAFFAWGSVANAESKDNQFVRSNSAFSEAGLGMDFVMYSGIFDLIPTLAFVAPLQKIDPSSDLVAGSEGVIEFHTRLNLQKDFGSVLGYSWLGFNYRSEGRSFLMPWGVGFQHQSGLWVWGAEVYGFNSVTNDTNDNVLRDNYINNAQGGSLKFYSKNPALVDSQVYGLWQISKSWALQANAGMTLAGSNMAAGVHLGGFIRYTFDLTDGYRQPPETIDYINSPVPRARSQMLDDSMSSEKEVRKFKEATQDGVDQKLFKPRPTKKPRQQKQRLQQELDKTEFQIELRRKKNGE